MDPVQQIVVRLVEITERISKHPEVEHLPVLYDKVYKVLSRYNDHTYERAVKKMGNADQQTLLVQTDLCIRLLELMDCLQAGALTSMMEQYIETIPDSYTTLEDCISCASSVNPKGYYSVTELKRMSPEDFDRVIQKHVEQTSMIHVLWRDHIRANEVNGTKVLNEAFKSNKEVLNLLYTVKVDRSMKNI
jgi:hypothetical protein